MFIGKKGGREEREGEKKREMEGGKEGNKGDREEDKERKKRGHEFLKPPALTFIAFCHSAFGLLTIASSPGFPHLPILF